MKTFKIFLIFFVVFFVGLSGGLFTFSELATESKTFNTSGTTEFSSKNLCHGETETCFSDYHCCSHYCANDGRCAIRNSEYSCKRNGLRCSDLSECCSGSCLDNKCYGTSVLKSRVGEPCFTPDQCHSGHCGVNNRCEAAENDCLPVGFRANDSYQCCSQNLFAGLCIGSSLSPSPSGAPCFDAYECASKVCINQICR